MIFDGGPAWRVERALDAAHRKGVEDQVPVVRREMEASLAPAPSAWFGRRLTVLWTLFMVGRETDTGKTAVWMAETAHLLGDLPHDIVAHSIDQAIRSSRHGFIPSVGEIRQIAEPLANERNLHIDRLAQMEAALADPEATAERVQRRREQALRDAAQ